MTVERKYVPEDELTAGERIAAQRAEQDAPTFWRMDASGHRWYKMPHPKIQAVPRQPEKEIRG